MKVIDTKLPDVKIIEPTIINDERGFFYESFNQMAFEEAIQKTIKFQQDNHSKSIKGVIRGLHYQLQPKSQGKLVRVVQGEVLDVAVDIRQSSPTFGKWVSETLSSKNKKQLWIPEGFAHGFLTLTETAEFLYKTTNYYAPDLERCIRWDDAEIGISWPKDIQLIRSPRDTSAVSLRMAEVFD